MNSSMVKIGLLLTICAIIVLLFLEFQIIADISLTSKQLEQPWLLEHWEMKQYVFPFMVGKYGTTKDWSNRAEVLKGYRFFKEYVKTPEYVYYLSIFADKIKEKVCKSNMKILGVAEEAYLTDNGRYTDQIEQLKNYTFGDFNRVSICPTSQQEYKVTTGGNLSEYKTTCKTEDHSWYVSTGSSIYGD